MNENNDNDINSFVFYPSFLEQVSKLKNKDVQFALLMAIVEYGINGKDPDFSPIDTIGFMEAIFSPIKFAIDKAKEEYRRTKVTCKQNGKKGGAPKGSRNNPYGRRGKPRTNQELTETNQELTETKLNIDIDIDKNKDINKDIDNCESEGEKPSLDEIKTFVIDNGLTFDPSKFFYYYNARNWESSGKPISDWRSLAMLWDSRERDFSKKEEQKRLDDSRASPLSDFINKRLRNEESSLGECIAKRLGKPEPQAPTPAKESEDLPF